jgi:hypothetical protein
MPVDSGERRFLAHVLAGVSRDPAKSHLHNSGPTKLSSGAQGPSRQAGKPTLLICSNTPEPNTSVYSGIAALGCKTSNLEYAISSGHDTD